MNRSKTAVLAVLLSALSALAGAAILLGAAPSIAQTTLTIATVNNGDMIRMQALTSEFTAKNPDITVKWVTLEENVLRQRVTTGVRNHCIGQTRPRRLNKLNQSSSHE